MTDGSARETYERWIRAQGGDPELDALPRAPVVHEVLAPRRRDRDAPGGASRSASRHSSWEAVGARKTTRSTTRSASSAAPSAARPSRQGRFSRTFTRVTRRPPRLRPMPSSRAYEISDEAPYRARHPPRRHRRSADAGASRGRDRSARSSRHASPGGRSRAWRSSTRVSRVRSTSSRSPRSSRGSRRRSRAAREVPRASARERPRAGRAPADDGKLRIRADEPRARCARARRRGAARVSGRSPLRNLARARRRVSSSRTSPDEERARAARPALHVALARRAARPCGERR